MNKTICIVLTIILILVVIRAISTGGRLWGGEENYRRGFSDWYKAANQIRCANPFATFCSK